MSSPEPKALRIFLAHAHEDKEQVLKLYDRLKAQGYKPWLDKKDLLPGQQWREEIPKAIRSSDIFLACLSQISVAKQGYVQREFRMALNACADRPPGTIYLIPLRFDDCQIPELRQEEYGISLRDYQWLDYFETDGFERLVQSIRTHFPGHEYLRSSIRVIPSFEKKESSSLLIIDDQIAVAWGEYPKNINIFQELTLDAIKKIGDLEKRAESIGVKLIEPKDLFSPELTFVDLEDAFPGAFPLNETSPITFNDQRVSPLLPLNPILLEYFTPKDLVRKVYLTQIDNSTVRVILDLPLSGINNDENTPQNYRIFKDYPIKEENALSEVPVLEIWPHFCIDEWLEYYTFYYDGEYGEQTFRISLENSQDLHHFKDGRGTYQIYRSESFPEYIKCQDISGSLIGLILLRKPEKIELTGSWRVGVDFDNLYTNIYVNRNGIVEPLPLECLHLKVTEVQIDTRLPVLFEYFIPEGFLPSDKPLPLASVLTTRGKSIPDFDVDFSQIRPIFDGRIYVPSQAAAFKPREDWMITDLDHNDTIQNRLFIANLALLITATAAKNGIRKIHWLISYPSSLSLQKRNEYIQMWREVTEQLKFTTGVSHICPSIDDHESFRSASLAFAYYFSEKEEYDLAYTTCINIGENVSDVHIWENNQLIHQYSLRLAERSLVHFLLRINKPFLYKIFELDERDFSSLDIPRFETKLSVLFRLMLNEWLKNERHFYVEDNSFQGFIRLLLLGVSGLYFYIGKNLRVLNQEGKYIRNTMPPIYVGGRGSRLLHWLASEGEFGRNSDTQLFLSHMLSKGSGFRDTKVITHLSSNPEDEVACGLVIEKNKLKGIDNKKKELLIAGEDCIINGSSFGWQDRIELEEDIQNVKISGLNQLAGFLIEFNCTLQELDVDGLRPMPQFKNEGGFDAWYEEKMWEATQRELSALLLDIPSGRNTIDLDPPFILGLKALIRALGREWAGRNII